MVLNKTSDMDSMDIETVRKIVIDMQMSGYETAEMRKKIQWLYGFYNRQELYSKAHFPYRHDVPVQRTALEVKREMLQAERVHCERNTVHVTDVKIPVKEVWSCTEQIINNVLCCKYVWNVHEYDNAIVVYLTDMTKQGTVQRLLKDYKGEVAYAKHV